MSQLPRIAVVAMDGIFPGAPTLDRFWRNIVDGIDQSAPVPPHRWIAAVEDRLSASLTPDRPYSRHACLIDDFVFDPDAFALDPEWTRQLDPVHQLTLTAGKRAVEACNTGPIDLHRVDTILAAIALPTDAASAFSRHVLNREIVSRLFCVESATRGGVSSVEALSSRVDGLPAALLAAEMGFGGDRFTLDAACASSIYAVQLACDALAGGRADMVVTGGVSRPECLYTQTGFSQLQALSPTGRCAPFDQRADGLVVGEGVGILVLKRLDDALSHGDTIHGVIHGIGLSNDLRGNLLAPERDGQVRAMRQAYRMAGWRPSEVDYIECHGTGTRTGDATEIESLIRLWEGDRSPPGACAIGSVKSMIGHLLTAAGAAGMIKTLLAMRHRTLPPSANFRQAAPDSPLNGSPFRVQAAPAAWPVHAADRLPRAAVSAFGFGGINAHILFEAGPPAVPSSRGTRPTVVRRGHDAPPREPVAIVGMDVQVGMIDGLRPFADAVTAGRDGMAERPRTRWKDADAVVEALLDGRDPRGAYIETLSVGVGEFQIPPNEIGDILPQQLLALKVGARALADAGLSRREPRERMGVVVGIAFDFEATNYHLRWQLSTAIEEWRHSHGLSLDEQASADWLARLRDGCCPPLTAPRVLGALGGIVASRMAREFRFGGPSFVVSADAASGIKALQTAVDLLQRRTVDAMLVGAVDLAGDARAVVRLDRVVPLSTANAIRPFDREADGTLPGDGAVALVLKPLAQARADGDRIYAVIRGIGSAGGEDPFGGRADEPTYIRSLTRCMDRSGTDPQRIAYVEAHASGVPDQDRMELASLARSFTASPAASDPSTAIALGSVKPISGHAGAADALIGVAKAALCLHRRILPPLPGFSRLPDGFPGEGRFHLPDRVQPWYRDRQHGPRTACCASITVDGACSHVLLEEAEESPPPSSAIQTRPSADRRNALFVISGRTPQALLDGLSDLEDHLTRDATQLPIEQAAARWAAHRPHDGAHALAAALIVSEAGDLAALIGEARQAVAAGTSDPRSQWVFYRRRPLGADARVAMVYPGSGNHYLGMGRELALRFPDVLAAMDQGTTQLKTQLRPGFLMPWRSSWAPGWEAEALRALQSDPLNMIFGQVVFGDLMTRLLKRCSIAADAVIGYSLGESAALFAHGIWADRGEMLARMQATDLFTAQLAGPYRSLRRAWQVPEETPVDWTVAVVNRPARQVREAISTIAHVRLLIVNAPDECVIGGLGPAVAQAIAALACQAVFLDGVVSVHCDAAGPVADAYRGLHHFATRLREGLTVYSCSLAAPLAVSPDACADSIKKQAVDGFDFTKTINRAYDDGIRVFIEAGPRASCTRMIGRILGDRPHLALAANHGPEDETLSLLRCLARLVAERLPLNLDPLYAGTDGGDPAPATAYPSVVSVPVGGPPLRPVPPPVNSAASVPPDPAPATDVHPPHESPAADAPRATPEAPAADPLWSSLIDAAQEASAATVRAHERFLDLSDTLTRGYADGFDLQNRLLAIGSRPADDGAPSPAEPSPPTGSPAAAFDRDRCMEFAVGRVGRVLGPAFDVVDTYRVRVRLPGEPLMLVDRILSVEGEMLSLGSGRVVTEHDVRPGAWYLDGDRAPVCISVEAGQADLFLSAYLGIDHQVRGERAYRLLDAQVTFHRGLPRPGETIRYTIAIDRFVRQGETWMFFFRFDGVVGDEKLITMRDGCAGFFTEEEVRHSGGILLTEAERRPAAGICPPDWRSPVAMAREAYDDDQLEALRRGDLAGCFGERFAGIRLAPSLRLPGGRMRLIDRILELDPKGGRYGLGSIRAEADIHPDDWFLTCHFVDDMVMPGTLMYECCAHTLRVFLQRMGWVTDAPGAGYEPVVGNAARLKCRGPVTPRTRHVHYQIEISRIGYDPEPFAVADAHMYADGRPIVFFKDMSLKLTGAHREAIDRLWRRQAGAPHTPEPVLYDRGSILAFAVGKPSDAFGEPYRVFDSQRTIARLPGPPYCFMDRVTRVEPPPWELTPGGWITAQYDVPPTAWYFSADRSGAMPFCVLLEIALQPCGWLAAYAGSALRSRQDLKFRNLGGGAVLYRQVAPDAGRLTMRCRLTKVSEAAEMIIEHFDFEVRAGEDPVYTGDTYFGFFSAEALARQKGLGSADAMVTAMAAHAGGPDGGAPLEAGAPLDPAAAEDLPLAVDRLALPGKALLMIDRIDAFLPDGGPSGLGYIRGVKRVDPGEWFFKAHFFQDPVCPGSLGLESFLQLLKSVAISRWPQHIGTHRFRLGEGSRHTWSYRGQIIPKNKEVVVEAIITHINDGDPPLIRADGLLSVDGLPIYKMERFELALIPANPTTP